MRTLLFLLLPSILFSQDLVYIHTYHNDKPLDQVGIIINYSDTLITVKDRGFVVWKPAQDINTLLFYKPGFKTKEVLINFNDFCARGVCHVEEMGGSGNYNYQAHVCMDSLILNEVIRLDHIYYDFDKWNIRDDASVQLDRLVDFLRQNPFVIGELSSHTDVRGSDKYNLNLSEKRAESAYIYLVERGVGDQIHSYYGAGESKPILYAVTEEEHQLNRRTEFRIIGIDESKYINFKHNSKKKSYTTRKGKVIINGKEIDLSKQIKF